LPPKPPPISVGVHFTRLGSIASTIAEYICTLNGPCVEHQIEYLPSSLKRTVQACGSM
jgi:hypothetical protein